MATSSALDGYWFTNEQILEPVFAKNAQGNKPIAQVSTLLWIIAV